MYWFGYTNNQGGRYRGTGKIDNIYMFSSALSETEITRLANGGNGSAVGSFTSTDVTIKYIKHIDNSRQIIRVNDPSEAVDRFTVTNGTDTTPAVSTPKDGILIDFDQNIASSSGYAVGNFAVTEGAVSKSVRAVKITSDNKVFLSMLTDINRITDTLHV